MGTYAFATAISEQTLGKLFDEQDQETLEAVIQTEAFKSYADSINKQMGAGTLENALKALSYKEMVSQGQKHVYSYAFLVLCLYCGQSLPNEQEIKVGYETDLIDKYLKEDFGIDFDFISLFNSEPNCLFDDPDDAPYWGFLSLDKVKALSTAFQSIEISQDQIEELYDGEDEDDEDRACAYEHIKGLKENWIVCVENQQGFMLFAH